MRKLNIWQQSLLHGALFFFIVELRDAWKYRYRIKHSGNFLFNADGTAVTQWQRFVNSNYYNGILPLIILLTLLTELNYHFFFKKNEYRSFLIGLFFSVVFIEFSLYSWTSMVNEAPIKWGFTAYSRMLFFGLYIFFYALSRNFIQNQILRKNRDIRRKDAEIKALKAQIHPHFFFNTLNTIYGTSLEENAVRTAKCIEQLSEIMRYTITGTRQEFTPLSEEIEFIRSYIQLQRLRIPERENIQVETDITIDDPSIHVVPLLLLPFIENAFKYGISSIHDCKVKIRLNVKDKILYFGTENPLFNEIAKPVGLGTGIENARQRLELSYPGCHQLSYGPHGHDFKVELTLNLN